MPTAEQILYREVLDLVAKLTDGYDYLVFCLPPDEGDEEWLYAYAENEAKEKSAEGADSAHETSNDATSQVDSSPPQEENPPTEPAHPGPVPSQHEEKYHLITMQSSQTDQWSGLMAALDTGTDENWISQDIVDRLRLDVTKDLVARSLTFNGQRASSCGTVRSTWRSQRHGVSHQALFRVVANASFDVLFGRNLLCCEEIDFFKRERKAQPVLVVDVVPVDLSDVEEEHIEKGKNAAAAESAENAQADQPVQPHEGREEQSVGHGKAK